ncbi:MAG: TrkH family potassium uptake protein [Clostridia bacterium]|nr:TrkH family potassium uptake protein [Clostridia bacterium]
MNGRAVRYFLGHILRWEAILMLPALIISVWDRSWGAINGFLLTIAGLLLVSSLLLFLGQKGDHSIQAREGFVIVGLGWVLMSVFGALPFFISGGIPRFVDALFETTSGFTTTGGSILTNIEGLSRGLLFWRSFTHWIGGMGVLVFVLAIVPQSKGNGESLHLLRAESPGPDVGKVSPTMRKTTQILYAIYIGLTLVTFVLLLLGGMPAFDSFCNAVGAAGTGGFAIKNAGIAAYSSYSQTVLSFAMLLFGVNFSVYYLILTRQALRAIMDEELHWYLGIILGTLVVLVWNTRHLFTSLGEAIHHVFFTICSIITTTGFSTVDFNTWPEFSKWILVLLMFMGASAGSTGGGMKVSRILILVKSLKNQVLQMVRPRSVHLVRLNKKAVEPATVRGVHVYTMAYFFILAISALIVSLDNFDGISTLTGVIACISNIGPGLNMVGPTGNFSQFSDLSKIVFSLDMLFGRLEIFPMLLLFSPAAWRRKG